MLENSKLQGNIGHESEVRRVQAYQGEKSLTIVLPKTFAHVLGIEKGDYLKVKMENNKLILEKADV